MGCTAFAIHIANRNLADRGAIPRCQSRNKAMQLTVQRHLVDDLPPVGFEGGAKIVNVDIAELSHQPVRATRWNASHHEVIDSLFTPSADDVVPLPQFLKEARNVVGIVLKV